MSQVLDQIAYFGYLDLLRESMRVGWEKIKTSYGIADWGIHEYACRGSEFEILYYLLHTPKPSPMNSALVERIEFYLEPDEKELAKYLACLSHNTSDHARIKEDFVFQRGQQKQARLSKEKVLANLSALTNEFLSYLLRDETMPHTRAEMARTEIYSYLKRRVKGEFKKKIKTPVSPFTVLCPDFYTFDEFLGEKMDFLSYRLYRSLACFEAVPAWLRFLETKGLIDRDLRKDAFFDLADLFFSITKVFLRNLPYEKYPLQELKKAWSDPDIPFSMELPEYY